MSVNEEEKEKPKPFRRSSLKSHQPLKFDPDAVLKPKGKRNSVSWGKSNTFQFKAMKAMFTESVDLNKKETEEDKKKHQQFLENRKASIKNEFTLIKELMKKTGQPIIEEENDEEAKNNMKKNLEIGKEALKEISESSQSKSKCSSSNNSDDENKSKSKKSSKSVSKSVSKSGSNNESRQESEDEKENKKEKKHKNHKKGQKSETIGKKSKLKNKNKYKDDEKDKNLEKEDEKENEKISVKKNIKFKEKEEEKENHKEVVDKKKIKVKVSDNLKKKEKKDNIKEEEDKPNENGKNGEQKLRLITLKEAHNIELEKIAYITLIDGSIVIIKNQGENLVQDLLKFKNPLKNENKKIKIIDPFHTKSFSQNKIEIPTNRKVPQKKFNYQEYKNKKNNNLPRNKSYNKDINSENKQRTYIISTGHSNNMDSKLKEITCFPGYSTTFNKSTMVSNPGYSNQETRKYNIPSSKYKTNSLNFYQNQQSNYLDLPTNRYIYHNSRNIQQPNYVESSNNRYQYKTQFQNKSSTRPNYSNYMRSCRLIEEAPVQIYDSWNYNDNLIKNNPSNPQLVKPYYQVSQQNNRYQYQSYPINFTNRSTANYHNRINSNKEKSNSQMYESLNGFDNLEEEQYNSQNNDHYLNYDLNIIRGK